MHALVRLCWWRFICMQREEDSIRKYLFSLHFLSVISVAPWICKCMHRRGGCRLYGERHKREGGRGRRTLRWPLTPQYARLHTLLATVIFLFFAPFFFSSLTLVSIFEKVGFPAVGTDTVVELYIYPVKEAGSSSIKRLI